MVQSVLALSSKLSSTRADPSMLPSQEQTAKRRKQETGSAKPDFARIRVKSVRDRPTLMAESTEKVKPFTLPAVERWALGVIQSGWKNGDCQRSRDLATEWRKNIAHGVSRRSQTGKKHSPGWGDRHSLFGFLRSSAAFN